MPSTLVNRSTWGAMLAGLVLAHAPEAQACGGFFCSQTQPVNQAAERIIFADNGNGTVTAVIQILYEGPSENFSWLLPISTVPQGDDIAVASDLAFTRLQQATNPQYNLNTRVEGTCRQERGDANNAPNGGFGGTSAGTAPPPVVSGDSGVTVAASGVVGAFEWTALNFDPALPNPADSAVTWLTENGYDVSPGSEALLGPYLQEGMHLLALRLTKGSDSGSIRPIVLTYDAMLPAIPIKLTAVAANDDMGVMTWVSAPRRSVPFNYAALELNEARINWFNASSNYNDVVTAAANDAQGQGFVTEFAGSASSMGKVVWPDGEEQNWQSFKTSQFSGFDDLFQQSYGNYQGFDGFWDAVRATVRLPQGTSFEDFQLCPYCYTVTFSPSAYIQALEDNVIKPMRDVQLLLDRQPYLTRFYSTLSAADMTVDPIFAFNADLGDVNNVHSADRIIECNPNVYQFEANWRIELPQGGVIRGTPQDFGTWPTATQNQPANFRVLKQGTAGPAVVVRDNAAAISSSLDTYNGGVPGPVGLPMTPSMPMGGGMTPAGGSDPTASDPGMNDGVTPIKYEDGGCAISAARAESGSRSALALGWGLLAALLVRRKRSM